MQVVLRQPTRGIPLRPGDTIGTITTDLGSPAAVSLVQGIRAVLLVEAKAQKRKNTVICISDDDHQNDESGESTSVTGNLKTNASSFKGQKLMRAAQQKSRAPRVSTPGPGLQGKILQQKRNIKFGFRKQSASLAKIVLEKPDSGNQRGGQQPTGPYAGEPSERSPVLEGESSGQAICTLVSYADDGTGGEVVEPTLSKTIVQGGEYDTSSAVPPCGLAEAEMIGDISSSPYWARYPPPGYGGYYSYLGEQPPVVPTYSSQVDAVSSPIRHNPAPALIQVTIAENQPPSAPLRKAYISSGTYSAVQQAWSVPSDSQKHGASGFYPAPLYPPSATGGRCLQTLPTLTAAEQLPFSSLPVPRAAGPLQKLQNPFIPSPAKSARVGLSLPRPVAAGGCRNCVVENRDQLAVAAALASACPACPLLDLLSACEEEQNFLPGHLASVAAMLSPPVPDGVEWVRIFCGEAGQAEGRLILPAAGRLEPGTRPRLTPLAGRLLNVAVINNEGNGLIIKKGIKLGFGQPIYVKNSGVWK